jgi:SAM-dependent methyltransferase
MPVMSSAPPHWQEMARQWARLGSPLRPPAEDICFYAKTVQCWTQHSKRPPRALILGVTVEIYHLPWPSGTGLLALDHTGGMIEAVWPGPPGTAVCGDWQAIPLACNSRDVVFCDGGTSVLAYPDETRRMIASLERVLAPGGICALRLYAPPARKESPDAVLCDWLAGRIANLNLLKLRLAMAMQQDPREGVELRKIWEAIATAAPDFEALASRIGWSLDHLMAINAYRSSPVRYYFPTESQVLELFEESGREFQIQEIHRPTYALGERCPTLVFRKK